MGKFKKRDSTIIIEQKKFDTPISKELLEANDWCSCSYTLDDQDPYNVIMGWCPDPRIYTDITDIDIRIFFVYYDEDSKNFIYMFGDEIDIHTVKTVADLEFSIASNCTKYEYLFDCPPRTMD